VLDFGLGLVEFAEGGVEGGIDLDVPLPGRGRGHPAVIVGVARDETLTSFPVIEIHPGRAGEDADGALDRY
jgi:hypothetical protein